MPSRPRTALTTALLLLLAGVEALAEPSVRRQSAKETAFYLSAGALIILAGVFCLSVLSAWILRLVSGRNFPLMRTTLIFAAVWGVTGVVSGVIPMILLGALFAPAGRTM